MDTGTSKKVILFGATRTPALKGRVDRWYQHPDSVLETVAEGAVGALVLEARSPVEFSSAMDLLRRLYDDVRRPARDLHPGRVLALIPTGDLEAAFAFGRYGIAGVHAEDQLHALGERIERIASSVPEEQPLPLGASLRTARLGPCQEGEHPAVALGFRHAPETLALLDRYRSVLRAAAADSSVFADVATLIEVMVREGLTCQTHLATKAGAAHGGQFIGSFAFYRELRRTRYARIQDPPRGGPAMDVFIAVDEVLHDVLHLVFLANERRAGIPARHARVAEEISLTWWQAVVHNRVFPEWIADGTILEINDDFLLREEHQDGYHFWTRESVFAPYAGYPWVPFVLAALPERAAYIGPRPDLPAVIAQFARTPRAAFLLARGPDALDVPSPFTHYPDAPPGLAIV